jgi:hypothetical protein
MELESRLVIAATIFVLLFGFISSLILSSQVGATDLEPFKGSWACTTDVKVCSDGTTVNRTPPYCQFAVCKN